MLLGLPWWLWAIIAVVGWVGLKARGCHGRYRAFCRGIREDLSALLHQQHPEVKVLREQMGSLVVRMPDGSEKLWEMMEVYSRVMQQYGADSDPAARARVYQDAVAALFAPDPAAPLDFSTHGSRIKPQLVPPAALQRDPGAGNLVHEPVPGLGLEQIYILDLGMRRRALTEAEVAVLGADRETLRRTALANLRRDFPTDMVSGVLAGGSGTACQLSDGFDAARLLLLPELLKPGETVLAAVPHRDMLLLLPPEMADDPAALAEGLTLLGDGHVAGHDHPQLLDRAVRVTRDGFSLI